jgi:tripartite-type tricarboxylate transporter receptor subunit TctC
MRESGLPELKDFYLESYYGFMATPRTPAPIVAKLEADMLTVSSRPELRKRLEGAGLDMMVLNSTAMMNLMRADAEKYARTAKQAGIKVE